jgi:hypothetical protein
VTYESALGISSLRVELGEIVWKSHAHHLEFGRSTALWVGLMPTL